MTLPRDVIIAHFRIAHVIKPDQQDPKSGETKGRAKRTSRRIFTQKSRCAIHVWRDSFRANRSKSLMKKRANCQVVAVACTLIVQLFENSFGHKTLRSSMSRGAVRKTTTTPRRKAKVLIRKERNKQKLIKV
jgi:hypothetical protein